MKQSNLLAEVQKGSTPMYARVVTVQSQPGKTEEAVRIYRDSVMPAAKQQQGFKSAFLLTDPTTGKGVSITLWETEADMRVGEASGYFQEQLAKFAQVFAAPATREGYEVSVQV
jgi:heme-degrading monooxygenase HmoA